MSPRHWVAMLLLNAASLAAQSPAVAATRVASVTAWTRITYLSGRTAYLEIGSAGGLAEGTSLDVVRAGAVVAALRVSAVSTNRAACDVVNASVDLVVGDSVRYIRPAAETPGAMRAQAPAPSSGDRPARTLGVRGRLGIRYLVINNDGGSGLTQPAYDLRLDGQHLGNSPFGISADVRAQRTQYASASGGRSPRATLNLTRVYTAALSWTGNASGARVTLGRQMAGALSSVGLFDGLGLDVDRRHWSAGLFAGSQPDAASMGLSQDIREYGAYTQWHSAPGARANVSLTTGGVGSYAPGGVDREYAFARWTSFTPWLSVYATQELDFNRGWKRDVEHTSTTPTATFASVQLTPLRSLALFAGYDNRRSVRLYRDYVSPELSFDDAFRQGMWGGASLTAGRYLRLSADHRDSRGGTSGTAGSDTYMASVAGITPWRLGLRGRMTDYTGSVSSGRLVSGAFEVNPWGAARLEANGGWRDTRRTASAAVVVNPLLPSSSPASSRLSWWGLDADIGVGRSLYILLSTYRERQDGGQSTQSYASISWRF